MDKDLSFRWFIPGELLPSKQREHLGKRRNRCLNSKRSPCNHESTFTDHLKAIAFTAGFHFAFIEQAGTSLYPAPAQRVTNLEVLRILLSIGPRAAMHFQTWQDKAGNSTPLTDVDPVNNSTVTFSTLSAAQRETDPDP